jgi:phage shock protein A
VSCSSTRLAARLTLERRKHVKLFERMASLIRADAHGVLDQLEERGLLLKQHLREAEIELDHNRARLAALEDELRRLAGDEEKLASQVEALDDDVEMALAGDANELARFAVRRLLPRRKLLEELRTRTGELESERSRLAERVLAQTEQFEALRVQVRAQLARSSPGPCWDEHGAGALVAEAEVDLELLRRRRAGEAPQ